MARDGTNERSIYEKTAQRFDGIQEHPEVAQRLPGFGDAEEKGIQQAFRRALAEKPGGGPEVSRHAAAKSAGEADAKDSAADHERDENQAADRRGVSASAALLRGQLAGQ